jgi:2-polyprenyl-3-methyl-5-hydroxy-6-metoxy-1,4-benzoquinol methylase
MEPKGFAFGKNWKSYISKKIDKATYESAEKSLYKFLSKEQLSGKSFLDVGCGSGIHSLVALRAGAAVTSIDYYQDSVECTQDLAASEVKGKVWMVKLQTNNYIGNNQLLFKKIK